MRYPGTFILVLILNVFSVNCQDNIDTISSKGNLYLKFTNINFIKNNEYSNPVIEGYTLIGYFLQPELLYLPDAKVKLRLGAHLLSYSGTNKFSVVKPLFSASYYFSKNTYFTLGTLSGSNEHRMYDPHFNTERLYNGFSEDGLQFRTVSSHLFNDSWLSWENFIFKGDSRREIFTAGESFRYSSGKMMNLLRVEIPVQVQFKHYGGQISNYPEHVETYLNAAVGARFAFDLSETRDMQAGMEWTFFTGRCVTRDAPSGIKSGHGEWYKLFFTYKKLKFESGYWRAHNFYAPNGNFIFGSVSDHLSNTNISDRKLVTGSANFTFLHEGFLELYLAFDGYYDTDLERFDNSMTIHLRFDRLFKLATLCR